MQEDGDHQRRPPYEQANAVLKFGARLSLAVREPWTKPGSIWRQQAALPDRLNRRLAEPHLPGEPRKATANEERARSENEGAAWPFAATKPRIQRPAVSAPHFRHSVSKY